MSLLYVLGMVAWAVPVAAGIWLLIAFRDLLHEIRLIRRFVQEINGRHRP